VTGLLLVRLGQRQAALLMALAAITYIVGAFLPTLLVNVPMNEALAQVTSPTEPQQAARIWTNYAQRWTWWNTLRTVFSLASLLLVGLAVFISGRREQAQSPSPARPRNCGQAPS
jgi:uncharacterized membrane protein